MILARNAGSLLRVSPSSSQKLRSLLRRHRPLELEAAPCRKSISPSKQQKYISADCKAGRIDMPMASKETSQTRHKWRKVVAACGVIAAGTILPGSSAHAKGVFDYLTGPLYEPIREDVPYWLRSMVWNDFRLAVLVFVLAPLVIWGWSLVAQKGPQDAVKRIMFGYWQAASLLMFTVYLQIGAQPVSFATAAAVQVLIPFTLWWWKDLCKEVSTDPSRLARVFKIWRLIATVLSVIGAGVQLLTTQTQCTALGSPSAVLATPGCAAWLEPPLKFKDIFHANIPAEQLQVVGQIGTLFFVANFLLYIATSLPRAGRLARSNKTLSYQVLAKLGFYNS